MKRTEFNLDQFPIDKGFYVIEAGAGSGKTYNLVRIVLRLLCRANDPVSIQKILLVTFTEAAAMEMRQRLREILEDCLIGEKEDLIKTLNEGLGLKVNKKRIRKALDFLGSMQITTIHGFCLRAYNDHAVNSGFPPLPGDPINGADLVEEITNDFIRLYPKLQTKLTSIRHCVKALFSDINTKIPDKKYPNLREFVRSRKNQSEVITFDHLITSLRDALSKSNDEKSSKLAKFIRADYQACLIDESQDTDGLQWDIFNTLFGPDSKSDSHLLVMVGDPKQSIYGFRGADINSYLRARLKANRIYTLSENWRSSPKMIDAFNQFFTNPDFFTKSSDQKKSEESNSSKKIICDEIKVPASRSQFPELGKFPIEIIDSDQVEQVAKEALRLLDEFDDPEFNKKGEKSPGADANVGILVRSNSEADKIYRALIDLGLGASLESDKSVFLTTTAFQIQLLLRATLKPAHTGNRKALLLSRPALFGPNVNLDSELDNELADWLAKALVKWNKYGFASAWQHLTRTAPDTLQTIVESLAQSSFRNRSLMDLSHIGELLITRTRQNHWSPQQTFEHLSARLKGDFESGEGESDDNEQQASDEEALRLDTPNARIMVRTIHKAKGLEYNAVIIHKCLDVGGKSPSRNGKIIRPDLASDDNQQDDLGTSKAPRLFLKGENEGITEQEIEAITKQEIEAITKQEIEEDARLLYVAMTRAKQRLVLMRKIIVGKEYYKFPAVLDNAGFDPFLSEESLKGDLKNLVSYLSPTQLSTTQKDKREIKKSTTLEVKIIKSPRPLKRTIGSTSYTGLSHGDNTTKERPGQNDGSNDDSGSPSKTGSSFKQLLPDGLKGSLLGIFIHEVLESLDFQTSLSNPDLRNIIEAKFRQAGLLPKGHADESPAIDLITKSISLWLTQPLSSHTQIHPNAKAFSLQKIAPQKQIAEVRFAYAADLDKKIIGEIEKAFKDEFNESPLSKLTIKWDKKSAPDRQESPLKGIIIGAIDYIFEHEGRYYIIDWKTNFLGKSQASYEKAKLEESISKEKYHLQFSLYTLALDAHMKSRLGTNWNYERDFGGVYYLYLRGFGANPESDLGVFYHRPTLKFIQTLSTCLQPTPDQNL